MLFDQTRFQIEKYPLREMKYFGKEYDVSDTYFKWPTESDL